MTLMSLMVGTKLSWFMTSIESRGAHKSGELWKHKRHESFKQVRASVRITTIHHLFWCIMIHWGVASSIHPFICQRGSVYKKDPSRLKLYPIETLSLLAYCTRFIHQVFFKQPQ
jgi:hypothetical protein